MSKKILKISSNRGIDRFSKCSFDPQYEYYWGFEKTITPRNGNPTFTVTHLLKPITDETIPVTTQTGFYVVNDGRVDSDYLIGKETAILVNKAEAKALVNYKGDVIGLSDDEISKKFYNEALKKLRKDQIAKETRREIFNEIKDLKFIENFGGQLLKVSDYPIIEKYISACSNQDLLYPNKHLRDVEYILIPLKYYLLKNMSHVFKIENDTRLFKSTEWVKEKVESILNSENPHLVTPKGIKFWNYKSTIKNSAQNIQAIEYPDGSLALDYNFDSCHIKALNAKDWPGLHLIRGGDDNNTDHWNKIYKKELALAGAMGLYSDCGNYGDGKIHPDYEEMAKTCRDVMYKSGASGFAHYATHGYIGSYGEAENRRSGVES